MGFLRFMVCFLGIIIALLIIFLIAAKINEIAAKTDLYKKRAEYFNDLQSKNR